MAVPNTFATATSAIPLANLDANFAYYDGAFSISGATTQFLGNVGIGNAPSAGYRLSIADTTAKTQITSTTGTNLAWSLWTNTGGSLIAGIESSAGGAIFSGTGAYSAVFGHSGGYPVSFATSNTERMRINSSGNVGIGTSSPDVKLQTNGIIKSGATGTNGEIQLARTSDGLGVGKVTMTEATQVMNYNNLLGSGIHSFTINATERMRLDSNGNLLLGTSSGSARLVVNGGTSTSQIRWEVNNAAFTQEVSTNAAANAYVYKTNDALYHVWKISSSTAMTLDSSARVYMGANAAYGNAKITLVPLTNPTTGLSNNSQIQIGEATSNPAYCLNVGYGLFGDYYGYIQSKNNSLATSLLLNPDGGNVGIGTSAPGYKLQVSGAIYQDNGYAQFGNYNAGGANSPVAGGISFSTNITNGQAEADVWNGNDPASYANTGILFTQRLTSTTRRDLMFLHNSGQVGIGTLTPTGKLDVRTAAGTVAQSNLYTGSNAAVVKFNIGQVGAIDWDIGLNATAGNFYIGGLGGSMAEAYKIVRSGAAVDYQTWNTGGAERMRIDSSGNVNIGSAATTAAAGGRVFDIYNLENTNSSSYALTRLITYNVAGTTTISADIFKNKAGSFVFNNNETNAAANTSFGIGGSERMRIDSSGNLLVGQTAVGTQNLNSYSFNVSTGAIAQNHITGTGSGASYTVYVYAGTVIGSVTQSGTTAVLYNTTSDQRLKENIQDAESASALIDALQVRQFDWKSDNSHQRYGFVAQELVTVAPEAVHQPTDSEEMMAVDYSKLVPMLVKEIQSLRKRLADAGIA